MSILALHPERRYDRTPVISSLIEQLGEGSGYHVYQLCHDERYRVQGELNKVFANNALARKAWSERPTLSLEEAAPLLASNDEFQTRIAEHIAASDRPEARKNNIVAALASPERIVSALRLIERLPSENVLFGNAVTYHSQCIVSALNFEVQALAKARLDRLRTESAVDPDSVQDETAKLSGQTRRFLSAAMPLVAAVDQKELRILARAYLGEIDQAVAEFAAKLVQQQMMLRDSRLRKKDAQIILGIDDAFRSFLCSVAVAYRYLMLAELRPDSELVRDYQDAAAELPLTHSVPNGKDTEIADLAPSDRLLEIYGKVKNVRVFREGPDKVVTSLVVGDFLGRSEVEAITSYRNLLRYSLAEGCVINLNGEAYDSDGNVKFRIKQAAYGQAAEESWTGFLHKQILVDYQRYRGGLQGRWCSNFANGSWINEPLDTYRLYRS